MPGGGIPPPTPAGWSCCQARLKPREATFSLLLFSISPRNLQPGSRGRLHTAPGAPGLKTQQLSGRNVPELGLFVGPGSGGSGGDTWLAARRAKITSGRLNNA